MLAGRAQACGCARRAQPASYPTLLQWEGGGREKIWILSRGAGVPQNEMSGRCSEGVIDNGFLERDRDMSGLNCIVELS